MAQTGLYKQDVAQLTGLTVTRQDCYHGIAAMGLTILTAIYCPGRVGLHTSPPPGWLMGLAFLNIAGAYMFLGLTLWLAMHAAMRADTAATHMLTRFVRLPIPSQGMLDKARKFLASYEEQPLKEVFRVPFTRHQRPGSHRQGGYNDDMAMDDDAVRRSRHDFDVPAWYRKEKAIDCQNTVETVESMMPFDARGSAPEHFEAYREMQHEWFPYDVYARLSIFLAFMHLTHCWAYMQIGHQFQETRAMFACAITILCMFVLQQIILTLDIIPDHIPFHRIGPFGLWFAYVAAAIEYKRWYSADVQAFGFFLVYCAYFIHIFYTLSLLWLCAPASTPPAVAETPGASWWPGEWRLPSAFKHAIWLVAPPKQLQDNETDIVGELRQAQGLGGAASPASQAASKRADVHRALGKQGESPAWLNVRTGLQSLLIGWIFLTFGFTIEVINQGTSHPSLLNAPGLPNNARDPRYRPAKPGAHEPVEVGTGGVEAGPAKGVHSEAVNRRLQDLSSIVSSTPSTDDRRALVEKLRTFVPHLKDIASAKGVPTTSTTKRAAAAATSDDASLTRHQVSWPALFEPHFLVSNASSPYKVLALSRYGRGALVNLASAGSGPLSSVAISLAGVASQGILAAAHWDHDGLLLTTTDGVSLECPGNPTASGRWQCSPIVGMALPVGDVANSGEGVAVSRGDSGLRAAIVSPGEGTVIFMSRSDAHSAWLPTGEIRIPKASAEMASFAGTEALLLASAEGSMTRVSMIDGHMTTTSHGIAAEDLLTKAYAQVKDGRLARLVRASSESANFELVLQ